MSQSDEDRFDWLIRDGRWALFDMELPRGRMLTTPYTKHDTGYRVSDYGEMGAYPYRESAPLAFLPDARRPKCATLEEAKAWCIACYLLEDRK